MMKKNFILSFVFLLLFVTACNKDEYFFEDDFSDNASSNTSSSDKSGETNGVSYTLSGLVINPDVVVINEKNAQVESSMQEISDGILKLSDISGELAASLNEGAILYVRTNRFTVLKRITGVENFADDSFLLSVEQAHLGEIFDEGTIDLSIDLNKSAELRQAGKEWSPLCNSFELSLQDEFDLGNGMKFNPATDLRMAFNIRLAFVRNQILPSEFSTVFEFQKAVNPSFTFENSINRIDNFELAQYIPAAVMDFIKSQEIEFDIPINMMGIESLPARVRIRDVQIPIAMETNLSKQSVLGFDINSSFRFGYRINIDGLRVSTTPIFENAFFSANPSISNLHGELITNSKIIIDPIISILNGAYEADGELVMEKKSINHGNILMPGQLPMFGSEGSVNISASIVVDLILLRVPVNLINQEIISWSVGEVVRSVVYSDMTYNVTSSNTTNLLLTSRMFATDFMLRYKYPMIIGKRVPDRLLISYDVYQDNRTTRITSVVDQEVNLTDITADSFRFRLNIPFRLGGFFLTTPQSRSYIKNIVIRDHNGYEYHGIFNTARGVVENEFEIRR